LLQILFLANCDNYGKVTIALEKPGKLEGIFLPLGGHCQLSL